ncbi:uncharacterized protein EDB91DRAFT_1237348 [Suillus paluster]|uniref:uncharacterized protein n=1 Tax=Suillus paluster TaxID=48578 RepID=UPI001B861291|nr:uncharacterized protein EDB91DRAFT_1237348 [Suillus paluster]KAG1740114.1 hypothetical protein EDB91DRAFT_1237348 [Suillus paluster]
MNFSNKIFEDFNSDHLPGNSRLQSPEDKDPEDRLEWNVDEDKDDLEEVDNDGWVAEKEADWEPPIQGAEEPAGINDDNIPMDEEDMSYHDKLHGNNWAPFTSCIDYEVAQWAKVRGQGSTAFSDLLDIEGVCKKLDLSYRNSRELNKIIDTKIPAHCPHFQRQEILMAGEAFDVYFWDIIECVKALFGDPELTPYLVFVPERHYSDEDKTQHLYHEMHTGQWWWHTQKQLEKEKPCTTIIPILLSSDKTQILVGYIPTTKLKHITNKAARRRCLANLFHACMRHIVSPLVDPGKYGMPIASGDGTIHRGHPLVACYIGDYPEQLLVTGMKTGECLKCDIPSTELGSKDLPFELQNLDEILDALALSDEDLTQFVKACHDAGIKPLYHPFWEELPHCNIYNAITPDVLHQLYQGLLKHMISWIKSACGEAEIDAWCKCLPPNHNIRLFMKGILVLIIINIHLPDGASLVKLIHAVWGILDFLYLAQYPCHSDLTLTLLSEALNRFHDNKAIFVDLGIRSSFNLPKLHSFRHYITMIHMFRTMDNYNTEYTERLHIDLAKDAYPHSDLIYLRQPKLVKHPSVKWVTFALLADHYGTVHFQAAVAHFTMKVMQPNLTVRQSEDAACDVILPFQSIAVFHKVCYGTVDDDGMVNHLTVDAIHARPARHNGHNRRVPARFDTVLINLGNGGKLGR